MDNSKQAAALRFQNFLTGIMFVFLWGMVFFQYEYLIPSHKIIMSNHGKDFHGVALLGLNLYDLLFGYYCIAISILLFGLTYIRLETNPDTGKKRVALGNVASIWRKIIQLVLTLLAMALVAGALACTVEVSVVSEVG